MCRWCLGRVSVMCSDCVMMFCWYVGDALVLCWWCLCSVSVMLWCLSDGWWCCGDVFVMVLWCFGDEYWWTFSNFQWVPKQNEWLSDVSLLLGSFAGLIALLLWTKCFGTPSGLRNQSMADSTIMNAMLKAGHKAQTDWEKTHIRKLPTIQTIKAIKGFRQGQKEKLAAWQKRVASNPLGQNPISRFTNLRTHPYIQTSIICPYIPTSFCPYIHTYIHT